MTAATPVSTTAAAPVSGPTAPTGAPVVPARASRPVAAVPVLLLAALLTLAVGAPTASAAAVTAGAAVPAAASAEPAWLRPAHLVPDLGAMDIRLSPFSSEGSGTPVEAQPLLETTAAYGAVGQYGPLPPGRYAVSVRPAGTPVSVPPLLSLTFELEAGQAYTVAGLGSKAEPRLERLVDDLTPPGDGSANVRLLPASLAAPTVDVQAEGGPVLADGAGLGRPTGYTSAPAGSWTVRASGGDVSGSTELQLDSGTVYTLLVLDSDDGSLVVRPVVDAVGTGTTPVGGAETGFGGPAVEDTAFPVDRATGLLGASVLALVAGLLLVLAVRRPTPVPARGRRP